MSTHQAISNKSSVSFTGRLAEWSARHKWVVLLGTVVLLVGAFFLAGQMNVTGEGGVESTDARRASALIEEATGAEPRAEEFVLVEANGRMQGRTTLNGQTVDASGGQVLSLAPAVMLSYRNVMLKGGVDVPIWERVNDPNESADVKILAALELHW